MGRNGAGKSTLLSTLVGLHPPASGTVTVGGAAPHRTRPGELVQQVGLVPQEPRDLLYADTVAAECAAADRDAQAAPAGTCRALVAELLPGVPDATHPRDLSEGQRLTLALAVVLTARPPLLLLDEPTRGLDYAAKARLAALLRALAAEGHAIVLATHDVELAAELAHRVVILADGEVVADGPTADVVLSSPAFAPQVAKVLAPAPWLTVSQVARALEAALTARTGGRRRAAAGSAPAPGAGPRRSARRARRAGCLAVGVAAFGWPLLAAHGSAVAAHSTDAPWLFAALLPLLVAVVTATVADTGMDAKAVAMLGMLAAAGAALRPLGAGTAGIEPMFFLMVLSGRVLGPGFGFTLGSLTMFASALLTGGVGPWMPFQMLAMGWVTMGAGCCPRPTRLRGRGELALLAVYGAVSAVAYGTVMNLQGWPYIGGLASDISYDPHARSPRIWPASPPTA